MQACYVNTTHPDFLNGHRAMAIVNERLAAARPPPPGADPKSGRLAPGTINNNRDLDVDAKKEEPSFFGSFFSTARTKKKPASGASVMEAPPPVIKPQAALNERETMETEVISAWPALPSTPSYCWLIGVLLLAELLIHSYFNIVKREMIDTVPKAISLTLVNYAKENLQKELLQELYKPDTLDNLMKESEFVVNRRKECIRMVQALNKAEEIVSAV